MIVSKRISSILCFIFCTFQSLSAQISLDSIPKMKWGEYKLADLQLKQWATDTAAPAAVLGEIGTLNMEIVKQYYGHSFKVHRRIKIFKKEGFSRANVALQYISKDDYEYIDNIHAHTIAPNGMKYPVDKKAVVFEKIDKEESVVKITFPNVTEGCIIEYEYEKYSKSHQLESWSFQDIIPTRFSVLNLCVWSRYEYSYIFQGKNNLKSTTPIYDKTFDKTNVSFYVKDLPGLKDESFVTSIYNHLTRIRFQLVKYWTPGGQMIEETTTWDKTAGKLLAEDEIGKKYLKKGNFNKVLEATKGVFNPADSAKVKVQKLYDWVNKNITVDDDDYMWSSNTPNIVLAKRKGGVSNLNFLLLALIKDAGMEADPVLVSTRSHGVPIPSLPFVNQFNHALILVELEDNKKVLVDAGNPNLPMGTPSEKALNGQGWLLKKKGQMWLDIKPNISSQILFAKFDITEDGNFKGTLTTSYKSFSGVEQRGIYRGDETGKNKAAYLIKKNPDWQIQDLTCSNLDNPSEPLKETIKLQVANVAQITEGMMYVKPTLKSGWESNPFKMEERTYPVEFPYPTNDQYILNLTIPEGYKIEELPKSASLILPPMDAIFSYQVSSDEKTVKLSMKIQINKTTFPAENYKYLKSFFGSISAKLEEMIVLKKM
jgi:Domain of Unknown Function with PDB structure (DUF3857)/Transglutaminase-like superfamily